MERKKDIFSSIKFSTEIGLTLGNFLLCINFDLFFTLANAPFLDFISPSRQLFALYQIGCKKFKNFLLRPPRPQIFKFLKILILGT